VNKRGQKFLLRHRKNKRIRTHPHLLHITAEPGSAAGTLAEYVRSAGYPRVKARRLQALCTWLIASGDLAGLTDRSTDALRADLLAVHGVGPETACRVRPLCAACCLRVRCSAR